MKKLLVLSAILVGAASASQAGVSFHFGLPLPLPAPPGLVFTHPAPVVRPEVVVTPSLCEPQVVATPVWAPRVVITPEPCYADGYAYGHTYRPDRHEPWEHRSGWHDRDDRGRHGHDVYRR